MTDDAERTVPTRAVVASLLSQAGLPDRYSAVPLWIQTKEKLASVIRRAGLPPHAPLPSELDLCDLFGVSRPVIRAALDALTADGILVRHTRRGAFVAERKDELYFAGSNIGLFGEMIAKGRKVSTRLLDLIRREPDEREAAMLRLTPGSRVVYVRRVYLVDGVPMAMGGISLPAHRVPGLETLNLTDRSLNATLRERYGIVVARSERWLEAVVPTREQAEVLELGENVPVISIESVGWLADGSPVEYYNAVYSTRDQRIHLMVTATG